MSGNFTIKPVHALGGRSSWSESTIQSIIGSVLGRSWNTSVGIKQIGSGTFGTVFALPGDMSGVAAKVVRVDPRPKGGPRTVSLNSVMSDKAIQEDIRLRDEQVADVKAEAQITQTMSDMGIGAKFYGASLVTYPMFSNTDTEYTVTQYVILFIERFTMDLDSYMSPTPHFARRAPEERDSIAAGLRALELFDRLSRMGYVHGDAKPANVMVTINDKNQVVRMVLIDFGFTQQVKQLTPGDAHDTLNPVLAYTGIFYSSDHTVEQLLPKVAVIEALYTLLGNEPLVHDAEPSVESLRRNAKIYLNKCMQQLPQDWDGDNSNHYRTQTAASAVTNAPPTVQASYALFNERARPFPSSKYVDYIYNYAIIDTLSFLSVYNAYPWGFAHASRNGVKRYMSMDVIQGFLGGDTVDEILTHVRAAR
jgi:serine/threonine protein kinase